MKLVIVFMCCVVLSATAYPQSRTNTKSKNKPKLSRQELAPATPTPVAVSTNTSTVLTIATNSTPSVIVSTEAPKAGVSTTVPQPTSVPTTVGIASTNAPSVAPSTVAPPANATTARPEEDDDDEEDEDDNETSEEIDEDIDDQDEEGPEGDLLGAPPGPPQPFEEDNASFEGDDDDQEEEERAADEVYSNINGPVGNNKVVDQSEAKVRETSGGIDAYVPGYVTDQGEVLVPIDTLERGLQYTIISDRYVSIPQKKVSKKQQNPVYLYRQETTPAKANTDAEESSEEEAPEVIPVKISETSVIFATKAPAANDSLKEEIGAPGATSQSSESVEDEDEQTKTPESDSESEVKQVPLGAVPANRPTGEDDEEEVVGLRRANLYRRNFYPNSHLNYQAHFDYMNNVYDNRRLDYPVAADPYSSNFYRSYGGPRQREQHFRFNGPYSEGPYSSEDSLEDFGRSDFYDYY